jgi:hypothetical protein
LHNLKNQITFSFVAVENFLPLHCEPFFGEAISRLSGQLDRWGIASVAIAASQ